MVEKCCFVNDDPIDERHVAWFTTTSGTNADDILLMEVVECTYWHPQAPLEAKLKVLETRHRGRHSRYFSENAPIILVEAAQNNMSQSRR